MKLDLSTALLFLRFRFYIIKCVFIFFSILFLLLTSTSIPYYFLLYPDFSLYHTFLRLSLFSLSLSLCFLVSFIFPVRLKDESQYITCGTNHKISYWDSADAQAIRIIDGSEEAPMSRFLEQQCSIIQQRKETSVLFLNEF